MTRSQMATTTFQNVVIIDDDADIISQIEKNLQILKVKKYRSILSGELAIKELASGGEPIDLAFVDVRLPGVSGTGVLQFIKTHKDPDIKNILCVPLVGNISKDESTLIMELGFTEILDKPFPDSKFVKIFEHLLKIFKDPNSDRNFHIQYTNYLLEKKFKQAEELILPRIKKNQNSIEYLTMYAELLLRAHQTQKAEEFLNKVLKIDKNYLKALNLMSKVYIKSNRFDDAMKVLNKAKALSPQNIERLLVMGEINLGTGDAASAEDNFKSVLKLNSLEDNAAFGLGRALATQGKIEESKKVLSNLKKGEELASFFNNKGILLVRTGKYDEGISLYQNAIKVIDDPKREYLLNYNISLAFSKCNSLTKAIDYAKKAISQGPQDYVKPKKLLERLERELQAQSAGVEVAPVVVAAKVETPAQPEEKCLLTSTQMEFIMGGFDEEEKKEVTSAPAQEEEFITFGL